MIDSHLHLWHINRADCSWPTPELVEIYRDFTLQDYVKASAGLGITGTVLVQSQACDSDTDFLLELAKDSSLVKAVVGWADLESENFDLRLSRLMENKKFRGLRPMLQAMEQSDWILSKKVESAIQLMVDKKLRFDALIQPRHLPYILQLVERFPGLKLVIDHGAKPNIAAGEYNGWAEQIAALAAHPYVYCKLSGLITQSRQNQWCKENEFLPYIAHLYHCFGSARLMWGSDWPVVNMATGLSRWLSLTTATINKVMALKGIGDVEQKREKQMLFHATSSEFYQI